MREEVRGTGQLKMKNARAERATEPRNDTNTVLIRVRNISSQVFEFSILVSMSAQVTVFSHSIITINLYM